MIRDLFTRFLNVLRGQDPSLGASSLQYTGWIIAHRTSAEYDQHFPQYAENMQRKLVESFPGAQIVQDNFIQHIDEPFILPPKEIQPELVGDAKLKAINIYSQAGSDVLSLPKTLPAEIAGKSPPILPAASTDPNSVQGSWIVIVPMFQLEVSDQAPINGRWEVGDVSFVSRNQLAALLTPPLVPRVPLPGVWQQISNDDQSFAVISLQGSPNDLRRSVFFRIREAASILASTNAFWGKRHHASGFTLKGYPSFTARNDRFIQTDGPAFCGSWSQQGFLHPFTLDAAWHTAITQSGIIELFNRITDITLPAEWRRQIKSGAAMLGRSMMSLELADAFLLNVIGLETLLTNQGERNARRLFQRIKGMTGWHLRTARPNYETEIRSIHGVRCEIVHDSDYSNLTVELLLQADLYLANSLLNIVMLPATFPDKATLANTLDGFATHENWPTDNSIPFRWFGNTKFSSADLDLPLW